MTIFCSSPILEPIGYAAVDDLALPRSEKTTPVTISDEVLLFLDPNGYFLAWGDFEVVAFARLDFGAEQHPATEDDPSGAGKASPRSLNPRAPGTMAIECSTHVQPQTKRDRGS